MAFPVLNLFTPQLRQQMAAAGVTQPQLIRDTFRTVATIAKDPERGLELLALAGTVQLAYSGMIDNLVNEGTPALTARGGHLADGVLQAILDQLLTSDRPTWSPSTDHS